MLAHCVNEGGGNIILQWVVFGWPSCHPARRGCLLYAAKYQLAGPRWWGIVLCVTVSSAPFTPGAEAAGGPNRTTASMRQRGELMSSRCLIPVTPDLNGERPSLRVAGDVPSPAPNGSGAPRDQFSWAAARISPKQASPTGMVLY